jgi:hypothetical protein
MRLGTKCFYTFHGYAASLLQLQSIENKVYQYIILQPVRYIKIDFSNISSDIAFILLSTSTYYVSYLPNNVIYYPIKMLVCLFAGWLVSYWVVWLVTWLVWFFIGWLVGWMGGRLEGWMDGWLVLFLIGWLVWFFIGWLVGWLVGYLVGRSVGWFRGTLASNAVCAYLLFK